MITITKFAIPNDGKAVFECRMPVNAMVRCVSSENGDPFLFVEVVPGEETMRTFRVYVPGAVLECCTGKRLTFRGSYLAAAVASTVLVYEESDY